MKISTTVGLTGVVLCLLSNLTSAENTGRSAFSAIKPMKPINAASSSKANNYLGASIGQSSSDDFCQDLQDCASHDKNWKLFAGMRMNDNLVLEGSYVNLGTLQGQDTAGNTISQDTTAFTIAGVAGIPINDQIEVFGKAGAARWNAKHHNTAGNSSKNTGTDALIGAGANYDLGDNMGVRAEWERFKDVGKNATATAGDVDLLSVGVTFSSL
ncbi:MAG: hypothetical protein RI964_48 [Pseudomonadota bacterium]|jgi:opacity protein-like surface antigen